MANNVSVQKVSNVSKSVVVKILVSKIEYCVCG